MRTFCRYLYFQIYYAQCKFTHIPFLKCALAVFHKLLPAPHDNIVQKLLFELSTWHALAKLRSHTSETLSDLDTCTKRLGQAIRKFSSVTCDFFETRPLEKEVAKAGRRKAVSEAKKGAGSGKTKSKKGKQRAVDDEADEGDEPVESKKAQFNLITFKMHALGHYVEKIYNVGTTDNYNTQTVCTLAVLSTPQFC